MVDNSVDVRAEYVVRVTGTVAARPAENVNDRLPTGGIELQDCVVEILNEAEPPPFPISERADTGGRDHPAAVPLPRHPSRAHAAQPAPPLRR